MDDVWSYLRKKPLQRRITIMMAVVVGVAIAVSNVAGYFALRHTLYATSQSIALTIATELQDPVRQDLQQTGGLGAEIAQAGGVIVTVVRPDGQVVTVPGAARTLVVTASDGAAGNAGSPVARRVGVDTQGGRYVVTAVPLGDSGDALVIARSIAPLLAVLEAERRILLSVCLASILTAAVVAGFAARSGLRPVRHLTAAVHHVIDTQDLRAVSVPYARGDLAVLAASFNQLLRTLARSRERQTRLIADAGHELRTPLTSMTINLDLLEVDAHAARLTNAQRLDVVRDVRGQVGELNDLVNDLVHLADDHTAGSFQALDVRAVVESAVDRVRRRSRQHKFDVDLVELHMPGDRASLERALINLLDNAVKWSPPGSTIRVLLRGNRLSVADSGPGIPEKDLPFVFDRFFRGDTARHTHGTGLGLSIVAKSIEEHHGTITAGRSDDGGALFTIHLPGTTNREALPQLLVAAT